MPNLYRARSGGGRNIQKEGPTHFLSPPRACDLSLSLSLSLPHTLLHSLPFNLWVGMPSRFEDGFSCYLLNKIEL